MILLADLEWGQSILLYAFFYSISRFFTIIIRTSVGFWAMPSQLFHLEQAAELLEPYQNTPLCSLFLDSNLVQLWFMARIWWKVWGGGLAVRHSHSFHRWQIFGETFGVNKEELIQAEDIFHKTGGSWSIFSWDSSPLQVSAEFLCACRRAANDMSVSTQTHMVQAHLAL